MNNYKYIYQSVQSLSRVQLFVTQWIAAHQASLFITNCRSLPKLTCIESSPSPPAPNPSQHQGLFQWVNSLQPYGLQQCQAPLSFTNFRSLLKLMSIGSMIPSNHLILFRPLLLLPSILSSIRVFSNKSVLCIRWQKYWSFSISPSNEHPGLVSFRMDCLNLLAVQGLSRVFSSITVQKHHFFSAQLSLWSNSYIRTWLLEKP